MLFSGKENIFRCLVIFLKMLWKTQFYHVSYIFLHFLSFQTNISSTPTKSKFIKTQILNTHQQKKFHQIRDQFGSENNKTRTTHANRGGLTQSKQIGNSAGRSWVWRMVRLRFATIGDEWVWWWTSSTIWEMGSRSDDLGIARRTSSVLGFLGSSELLDVNRSRLRRCWGAGAISLPCCLSLSLFYFPGAEVIWSENENENYFPPLSTLFYGQTEIIFSLTEFSVTAKHSLFRKIISGISLKSIQTQP